MVPISSRASLNALTRPSATNFLGMTSTASPYSRSFASVPGPMAAILAPPMLRMSLYTAKNAWKKRSTPLGLENTSQSYVWACTTLSANSLLLEGGAMRMTGISSTSAPRRRRRALNSPAWARVRVTTMRLPNRGSFSNQFRDSRSFTTSPMTTTAGAPNPAFCTLAGSVFTVPVTVR